jgi:hypothetical protein
MRGGNEYLYQTLAQMNIEAMNGLWREEDHRHLPSWLQCSENRIIRTLVGNFEAIIIRRFWPICCEGQDRTEKTAVQALLPIMTPASWAGITRFTISPERC